MMTKYETRPAIRVWQMIARPGVTYLGRPANRPEYILERIGVRTGIDERAADRARRGDLDLAPLPQPPPPVISWAEGWLHDRDKSR